MTHGMAKRSMRGAGARTATVLLAGMVLSVTACSLDDLLGTDDLPPELMDPKITETPDGAVAAYRGALARLREGFESFVSAGGLLSDELDREGDVDRRDLPELLDAGTSSSSSSGPYGALHQVRGQTAQAIGLLTRFAPDSVPLAGHMYAVQAYAEIFLADLYCSGVPLSTLDFDGDFTYRAGSTTEEIYENALALLEAARPLVADSARFENLTRVGTARALLALGRFADAAAAVADVPDDFRYEVGYSAETDMQNFARLTGSPPSWNYSVGDQQGVHGLDYVSSGDPRTLVESSFGTDGRGLTIHHPSKYATDGSSPIVMASGIEARLIEAEAALQADDPATWLGKLNHLRQTMWTTIEPAAAGPLPDLTDPGTEEARIDLMFRERAFWLFLTGHRQGDLRRLIRQYGRRSDQVYPVGPYSSSDLTQALEYGSDVNLPIPAREITLNPHVSGCASRGA